MIRRDFLSGTAFILGSSALRVAAARPKQVLGVQLFSIPKMLEKDFREGIVFVIDCISGYGFPAYRGGPMFWAEHEVGLSTALENLRKFAAHQDSRFMTVSPLRAQLVAEGKGLAGVGS